MFIEMATLKSSVYQIHGHLMVCYKACPQVQACQFFWCKVDGVKMVLVFHAWAFLYSDISVIFFAAIFWSLTFQFVP